MDRLSGVLDSEIDLVIFSYEGRLMAAYFQSFSPMDVRRADHSWVYNLHQYTWICGVTVGATGVMGIEGVLLCVFHAELQTAMITPHP